MRKGEEDLEGFRVGQACFEDVQLPSGFRIPRLEQRWSLMGTPRPDGSNVILLLHSFTSGIDPREWWPGLLGRGRVLDPDRWAILTPALLGGCRGTRAVEECADGSDPGTASVPLASVVPPGPLPDGLTTRDAAAAVALILRHLGIPRVRLAAGGSVGGMVALEWAASYPDATDAVLVFAAPAAHTAQAIAFNRVQREALRLGGSVEGLALARQIAMLTYRSTREFDHRFGRSQREDGMFQVNSWLEHHGRRIVQRFDASSYARILDAMDTHDVGEGRDGVARALQRFRGRLIGVGIEGDQLYPSDSVRTWVVAADGEYRELRSIHGHDAFLLEEEQVASIFRDLLGRSRTTGTPESLDAAPPPRGGSSGVPVTRRPRSLRAREHSEPGLPLKD